MQLLIQRSQKESSFGSPVFDLWAKFELLPEEEALIQQYGMKKFALIEGDPWRDFFHATKLAAFIALVAFIASFMFAGLDFAITNCFLTFIIAGIVIYNQIKERIRVDEILSGKRFVCKSVVTLINKEDTLKELAQRFRQFLEAMKNWNGREVVDIGPGRDPQFRIVEPVHGAA